MKTKYRGNKYSSGSQFFITKNALQFAINPAIKGKIVSVSGYLYIFINNGIAAKKSAIIQKIIAKSGLSVINHMNIARIANIKHI